MEKIKSTQFVSRTWSAKFPHNFQEIPSIKRKEKMRKVIAHLNKRRTGARWYNMKPETADRFMMWFIFICLSWFIGRALWHWFTL